MRAYEAAYRYFRDELIVPVLGETLPDPILTFSRSSKRTLAFFAPEVWRADLDDFERRHELGIVPAHTADDPREVMASLVHEMLHFADYVAGTAPKSSGYHAKKWAARMEKIGLPPVSGPNKSRVAVSHEIVPNGPYARAYDGKETADQGWETLQVRLPQVRDDHARTGRTKTCLRGLRGRLRRGVDARDER